MFSYAGSPKARIRVSYTAQQQPERVQLAQLHQRSRGGASWILGIVLAVIAAIIVLLVIIIISKSVRIVQQGFEGVVTRFGEFKDIKNPGLDLHHPLH